MFKGGREAFLSAVSNCYVSPHRTRKITKRDGHP